MCITLSKKARSSVSLNLIFRAQKMVFFFSEKHARYVTEDLGGNTHTHNHTQNQLLKSITNCIDRKTNRDLLKLKIKEC